MSSVRFITCAILMLNTLPGIGQTADDVFDQANEHYREGRFREAVQAYSSILDQGFVSAALYFNLGNAHYRLGNVAETVLAYERAKRIDPSDPDIRFNLTLANLKTVDQIEAVPELFIVAWVKSLAGVVPLEITQATLVGTWMLFFVILIVLNLSPAVSRERSLRVAAAMSLAGAILAAMVFVLQVVESSDESAAIIMSNVVTAKASPDEQSLDTFVIHEGLKVRMEDAVGKWVRISLADGKVGWVPGGSLEAI